MRRIRYAWRKGFVSALRESDPKKLIGCIEQAITAIERRRSEWGEYPGTPAELKAVQKAISALETLLKEKLLTYGAVDFRRAAAGTSDAGEDGVASEFEGQAKRLLLVLRSTPLYGKRT